MPYSKDEAKGMFSWKRLKTKDSQDAYMEETALTVSGETKKRQWHSPS